MNIKNIEGGVSPLKAKRQSSRGGKHAGKATAKKGTYLKGRGGYAKSVGVRGEGGRNVGGYNIHTRFQPTKRFSDASGGGGTTKTQKPYSYDPDGNLVVNTKSGTPGYWTYKDIVSEHEDDNLESYQEIWDKNEGGLQSKWTDKEVDEDGGYAAWVIAAKKWNKENKSKTTTTKRVKDKWIPGTGIYTGITESK